MGSEKGRRDRIRRQEPRMVIGRPRCTMFSPLQTLTPWTTEKTRRWCEATEHIQFVVETYKMQMKAGRWFLHEHPAGASSRDLEYMK